MLCTVWGPQRQRDVDKLQVLHEERLMELGWEKRWLWGHITAAIPMGRLWERQGQALHSGAWQKSDAGWT